MSGAVLPEVSANRPLKVRRACQCGRPSYVSVTVSLRALSEPRPDNSTFWCRRCFDSRRLRRVEAFLRLSRLAPVIVLRSTL